MTAITPHTSVTNFQTAATLAAHLRDDHGHPSPPTAEYGALHAVHLEMHSWQDEVVSCGYGHEVPRLALLDGSHTCPAMAEAAERGRQLIERMQQLPAGEEWTP